MWQRLQGLACQSIDCEVLKIAELRAGSTLVGAEEDTRSCRMQVRLFLCVVTREGYVYNRTVPICREREGALVIGAWHLV
jgi:hypothetical protein